jgi:hypothetical protein
VAVQSTRRSSSASGDLHALPSGVDGGNGVFAYGPTTAFPTQTFFDANYWVDVVFRPAP